MRRLFSFGVLAAAIACPSVALIAQDKSPAPKTSVAGAWTRNAELSDKPTGRGGQGDDSGGGGSGRQGGGGGSLLRSRLALLGRHGLQAALPSLGAHRGHDLHH